MSGAANKEEEESRCAGLAMPILRITGALLGCGVIACGIYSMTQSASINNIVNNLYRIFFGILIILAEARLIFLLKWFSFLTFFGGLGAWYIFVGGLALGSEWYEITMAVAMCVVGIIYLGSACACSQLAQQQQAELRAKAEGADSSTAAPKKFSDIENGGPPPQQYNEMQDGDARRQMADGNPFGANPHGTTKSAYGDTGSGVDPFAGGF